MPFYVPVAHCRITVHSAGFPKVYIDRSRCLHIGQCHPRILVIDFRPGYFLVRQQCCGNPCPLGQKPNERSGCDFGCITFAAHPNLHPQRWPRLRPCRRCNCREYGKGQTEPFGKTVPNETGRMHGKMLRRRKRNPCRVRSGTENSGLPESCSSDQRLRVCECELKIARDRRRQNGEQLPRVVRVVVLVPIRASLVSGS